MAWLWLFQVTSCVEDFGAVESVKAASEVYAPVSGTVVGVNSELVDSPELINRSSEDEGLFFIKLTSVNVSVLPLFALNTSRLFPKAGWSSLRCQMLPNWTSICPRNSTKSISRMLINLLLAKIYHLRAVRIKILVFQCLPRYTVDIGNMVCRARVNVTTILAY